MTREEAIERIKVWNLSLEHREVLAVIIPELAESEDERMLREIKRYLKEQGDKPTGLPNGTVAVSDMIAWLEKNKEQKPAEWDELQSEFKSINEAFEDGKKEVVAHPEKYGLCDCEPKPEWGEKDEKKLKETLALVETIEDINKAKDGFLGVKIWLESLPERLVLQPKEEWSKEDGETLACAISVFEDFAECKSVSVPPASAKRYLKRLKSFRLKPKNELSEEDKEELIFNRLVSLGYPIDANGNIPDYNETFESCKSALAHWLRQNLRKMLMNKRIEPDEIKTETLLKDSYIQAYREGVEDSIRELSLL